MRELWTFAYNVQSDHRRPEVRSWRICPRKVGQSRVCLRGPLLERVEGGWNEAGLEPKAGHLEARAAWMSLPGRCPRSKAPASRPPTVSSQLTACPQGVSVSVLANETTCPLSLHSPDINPETPPGYEEQVALPRVAGETHPLLTLAWGGSIFPVQFSPLLPSGEVDLK